jgi:hypothetical protein
MAYSIATHSRAPDLLWTLHCPLSTSMIWWNEHNPIFVVIRYDGRFLEGMRADVIAIRLNEHL